MCSPFPLGSGFGVAIRNKDGGSLSQNVNTAASLARLMVYNCALLIHYCPNAAQLDRGRKFAPTIGVFERGSIIYMLEMRLVRERGPGSQTPHGLCLQRGRTTGEDCRDGQRTEEAGPHEGEVGEYRQLSRLPLELCC